MVAECSEHTFLKYGKRIDGTMYSCTSFGTKIGGGIGVALCGWLLDISGFVKTSAVPPTSCINMLQVMYLWIPMLLSLCITFIMSRMNVEGANKKLIWKSSNTKYATVSSSGKVIAKKTGKKKTVIITVMSTDGTNKKKTVKIKIK